MFSQHHAQHYLHGPGYPVAFTPHLLSHSSLRGHSVQAASGVSGVNVNTPTTEGYHQMCYDVKPPLDNKPRTFTVENSTAVVPPNLSNGNSNIVSNNSISGDNKRCVLVSSVK